MSITSAAGVVALLDENDAEVKHFALRKLDELVDLFWHEISDSVGKLELLYEDARFQYREIAALVVSKVYYHLGDFEDSVNFALGAGSKFDVNHTSEFVETIVSKCIDLYIKIRSQNPDEIRPEDAKRNRDLENVVNRMFQRCFDDRQYRQAVGIALETRRMDIFDKAILESDDRIGMLTYAFRVCLSLVQNRQFRNTVLKALVDLYKQLTVPDYISICQCLIFLDEPQAVADTLEKLIKKNEDSALMAYQIGFDLYESATQQFLQAVQAALRQTAPAPIQQAAAAPTAPAAVDSANAAETTETSESAMEVDDKPVVATPASLSDADKTIQDRLTKLHTILGGETTIGLHLQFLIRTNKTDLLVLKNTKDVVRNSVCHNATVVSNALMHCGTTCDQFLRDNLEWLARATNWARFTATASLGVIHKGHEKEALHLMSTYLPKDSGPGSSYSEGGGLYALGLIHANHGGEITEYLLNQLKDATTDIVRHGACLGLGLAAMGTARADVYDQLKNHLYQDDAVTGEAAGIAIGLVMLGTKSEQALQDMTDYARETQHEKILRGLAVGIALTMYGRLEEADTLIEQLSHDKDPILRWSAMFTVAMAYCGTGNNAAIQRLLHAAVSDVNDDVRRTAVTSLGFLLFRMPEQCPSILSLLSESYNPHVRYGAAMALGIACAGTGLKEAIALLEPMTNDPVNYVRQGALIASALVLMQHNENTCSRVPHFRSLYAKVISDKHEDVMAKFGAILAQGIIDIAGRNATISLQSRTGHTNMTAVVGLLVFTQFWYWYPLTHFLSLAVTPTSVIALNAELNMPRIEFKSNAKPSIFAYPPALEEKKDKNKEKVETAVLSITAKQAKRKEVERKKDGTSTEKMDVDEDTKKEEKGKEEKTAASDKSAKPMDVDKKDEKKEDKKEEKKDEKKDEKKEDVDKKEPEATFEMLSNPVRVMKPQLKVMSMPTGSRYIPLKDISVGGIIVMKNARPAESEDIIELVAAGGPKAEEEEAEPQPPEPFEWTDE